MRDHLASRSTLTKLLGVNSLSSTLALLSLCSGSVIQGMEPGHASLPIEAMASAARGAADERYYTVSRGDQIVLPSLHQGLEAIFSETAATTLEGPAGGVTLDVHSWGCPISISPIDSPRISFAGNRVELAREDLVEWYVSGPLGIEHGFTLLQAPSGCHDAKALLIDMLVDGEVVIEDAGRTVHFPEIAVRYRGLVAFDATGRELDTRLTSVTGKLRINVDVADAVWPVVVDPMFENAKLLPSNGAEGDSFGVSVATSGDLVVIGAYGNDSNGTDSGSAYVFFEPPGGWDGTVIQTATLLPSDATANDQFGRSVAIAGNAVAVGANGDDEAVYVFTEPAGGWTGTINEVAKLVASDNLWGMAFGSALAASAGTIVVGAGYDAVNGFRSGSAYVFVEPSGGWSGILNEDAKLLASDGVESDSFGDGVAASENTVVVGAPGDDGGGSWSGAAYVFVEPTSGWSGIVNESAKLTASFRGAFDFFGSTVAVSGEEVVVGAPFASSSGAAYVFVEPTGGWTGTLSEQARLLPSDGSQADYFGISVAADGESIAAGAYHDDDNGKESGSVYVFTEPASGWAGTLHEEVKLLASDGATGDALGSPVAISGNTVVAAAVGDDDNGAGSGSAYVFTICAESVPITADTWHMVAVACEPAAGSLVSDVLGDDLDTSTYGMRWIVYGRDEVADRYEQLSLSDELEVGRGYWIKTLDSGKTVDVFGKPTDTTCSSPSLASCYDLPLVGSGAGRANLEGHPFTTSTPWKDVLVVKNDGTELTLDEAETEGIISPAMYQWNGSAYQAYDGSTPGLEGTLEPMVAMWVQAFVDSSLRIPYGDPTAAPSSFQLVSSVTSNNQVLTRTSTKHENEPAKTRDLWYVRLVASSGDLEDPGNVLGQMEGASDGPDRHDLKELPPFGTPYLTIVFPRLEWGEEASEWYTSDYRSWSPGAKRWDFEVRTDRPGREVTLRWEGLDFVLNRSRLRDLESGKVVPVKPDGSYTFRMEDKVRQFRWEF